MIAVALLLATGFFLISYSIVGGRPSKPMPGRFLWFMLGLVAWVIGAYMYALEVDVF